jgi:hypothetical protein
VDVYFGPKAPAGMENNWVQTIPGKGWFMILRLYGPLEPWFAKTWRPGGDPRSEVKKLTTGGWLGAVSTCRPPHGREASENPAAKQAKKD